MWLEVFVNQLWPSSLAVLRVFADIPSCELGTRGGRGDGRTDGVQKGIVKLYMLLKVKNTINTNQSREERDFF